MPKRSQSRDSKNVVAGGGGKKRKKTDDSDIVDAVVHGKEDHNDKVEERASDGGDSGDNDRHRESTEKDQQQQSSSGSESVAESKFEVRQRVIARDEDGLMYFSDIRRKMYGVNHQQNQSALQTIGKGAAIFDKDQAGNSQNDVDVNVKDDNGKRQPQWMYFVHYEGWKTLWDRW